MLSLESEHVGSQMFTPRRRKSALIYGVADRRIDLQAIRLPISPRASSTLPDERNSRSA